MAETEAVTGQRVVELLQFASKQNALLTMRVASQKFEGLTVITKVVKVRRQWMMYIDPPKGFAAFADGLGGQAVEFSFRGPDLVEYSFAVSDGGDDGSLLRFPVPNQLERQQRRSDFRMETPPGTILEFTKADVQGSLDLINISISGILGLLAEPRKAGVRSAPLKVGDILTELRIFLPMGQDGESHHVKVKRAVVRRTEQDSQRRILRYAMEFLHVTPAEERKLVQFVYQLQRRFLRRSTAVR